MAKYSRFRSRKKPHRDSLIRNNAPATLRWGLIVLIQNNIKGLFFIVVNLRLCKVIYSLPLKGIEVNTEQSITEKTTKVLKTFVVI
jgi:hypothetical protein